MASDRHRAWLGLMLVLAMTSALSDHLPAICFDHLDYVSELQVSSTFATKPPAFRPA
jgi:hypothetical protein